MQLETPAMIRLARVFGHSDQCESGWEECLSWAHRDYIIDRVRQDEEREQAVIDEFLAAKER